MVYEDAYADSAIRRLDGGALMAHLPRLDNIQTSRDMIDAFGGYNHNLRIGGNEFYDMRNMSGDLYPVMAPRKSRMRVRQLAKPNGLHVNNALCWVDGSAFYYDGRLVDGLSLTDSPKRFVNMGAYIIIYPDQVMYNTADGTFSALSQRNETSGETRIAMCKVDGTVYDDYTVSASAPASPQNGALWLDTSATPNILKQYSTMYGMWQSVPTTYVKVESTGIGTGISEMDAVSVNGIDNDSLNGSFVVYGAAADYIVITGLIRAAFTQTAAITVSRDIPDMDYVTEHENRLWGCSSKNHEIYASALGDPKNWNRFLGIASDSYAVTVGSAGDFTGCTSHQGYVLFFKEETMHKMYGSIPSKFQLTDTQCRGVGAGSSESLVSIDEMLFYRSRNDVCALGSALPSVISLPLGKEKYTNGVGGEHNGKYYLSMQGPDHADLFVYDPKNGLWHREDETRATHFASLNGELFYIDGRDNCLYSVGGTDGGYADEEAEILTPIEWSAQFGDIGLDSPDHKYVSRIQFRLELDDDSTARIEVQYDHDTDWRTVWHVNMTKRRTICVPIIPHRCDTMRVRISGKGQCRIFSMTKTIEQGSEM